MNNEYCVVIGFYNDNGDYVKDVLSNDGHGMNLMEAKTVYNDFSTRDNIVFASVQPLEWNK